MNKIIRIITMILCVVICINLSSFNAEAATKKNGLAKPLMVSCKNTTPDWSKIPIERRATGTTYTLKWKKVPGAKGYQVQVCEMEGWEKSWPKGYFRTTKSLKYSISGSSIARFRIRVRAYKIKNGKKLYGPWGKWVEREFI